MKQCPWYTNGVRCKNNIDEEYEIFDGGLCRSHAEILRGALHREEIRK